MTLMAAARKNKIPAATCGILMKMNSSTCLAFSGLGSSLIRSQAPNQHDVLRPGPEPYRPDRWPRVAGAHMNTRRQFTLSLVFFRDGLDLFVEGFEYGVALGHIRTDWLETFLELSLLGGRQGHNLPAALLDPYLAQRCHFVDRGLPRPRLQFAGLFDDDLAQVRR